MSPNPVKKECLFTINNGCNIGIMFSESHKAQFQYYEVALKSSKKLMEQDHASCSLLIGKLLQLTVHLHSDMARQFLSSSETPPPPKKKAAFNSVTKTEQPQGAVWPSGGVRV